MVRNDADQSFASLSLTELLHPEAAASNITRRHNDESPWATVYYEAVSGPHSDDDVPVTFEVVEIHDDMEDANLQQPRDLECCAPPQHTAGTLRPLPKPKPWQHSNLIDLILGFSFTFAAFICTIKIELTAILLYTMAAGFHYLAEEVFSSTPAMLGKSICLIVCGVLMVFDPILLTVSVMVTELLGVIALLLCTIFGGARSGNSWHQFIRKTCHLSRWGFRSIHQGWKPERIFPVSMEDERLQLSVVPCEDSSEAEEVECTDSPHQRYSDNSHRQICTVIDSGPFHTSASNSIEESTMVSDVTFVDNDMECTPISIAPENVSLVQEYDTSEDQGEHLFKNTQHVIMV